MPKVIEVKYKEQQGAEELYISTGVPKKVYIRQTCQDKERVVWTTATQHSGGYEASSPIKAGVIIRVVLGSKKEKITLFEETMEADADGAVTAEKKERFACEQLKAAVEEFSQKLALHDYDSWAKWLLKDCAKHNYTGYQDNWLHFGTVPSDEVEVETLNIIGVPYKVVMTSWRHMVCEKTWKVVEIRDTKSNVLELCGYSYDV